MALRFVSYLRVSTTSQGISGLGLEAQREQVRQYIDRCGGELLEEVVEVESGKVADRPGLVKSIARCRRDGAVLVIAKLDRLARSVAFISSLMEAGVEFIAADMPFANKLMLHLMAAFAEHERTEIGLRTRAALAAAKARGVALGRNGAVLAARSKADAVNFALPMKVAVDSLRAEGRHTIREIAVGLNDLGLTTRQGAAWGPSTTQRLLARLDQCVGQSVHR